MADMVAKGRGRYPGLVGVSHGCAKLTEEQVFSIRASGETQYALADKYGVTQHTISRIKSRKTWKHI
jgi:DNA invertase Pin-like site-specific DNA recombinase